MEIPVPNSFENDFDVFDSVADIQSKICLAEDIEIKISLPHADLFRNRIRLFLLTCLNAFGAQKDKNIVFRCNFPSYAFDERNLRRKLRQKSLDTKSGLIFFTENEFERNF